MSFTNTEINRMVEKIRKTGWDGFFPVNSQYISHTSGYVMRKYARLKDSGRIEEGETIVMGTEVDERWARMMVAHILMRSVAYQEMNFEIKKEDVLLEETQKQKTVKQMVYELMMPRDFINYLIYEREQRNKMILANTFGVPEEVLVERFEMMGIDLKERRNDI